MKKIVLHGCAILELLFVVTTTVVLLALPVWAMDKSVIHPHLPVRYLTVADEPLGVLQRLGLFSLRKHLEVGPIDFLDRDSTEELLRQQNASECV